VLLNDGRVIFVLSHKSTMGIFNPATNSYKTTTWASGGTYYGGVLLGDGRVVFVPWEAAHIGILTLSDEKARARALRRAEAVKEELVAAAWHPKRMADWCMDDGERRELAEMWRC
jgi:streptogramin lyase